MTRQMKYHLQHLLLWVFVAIGFAAVFFRGDTLAQWGDNPRKTLMAALLIVIGYGGDIALRILYRKRSGRVDRDERDDAIQTRGLNVAFIGVLLYVFLVTISLYTRYEAKGAVPVGWLWFIAYSLIVMANLLSSATILVIYLKEAAPWDDD